MPASSPYTGAQLAAMQQDAVRRVQEMQRQAEARVQRPAPKEEAAPPSPPCDPPQPPPAKPPSGFRLSEDTILLGLLLLLLLDEGADGKLILALCYILLF